MAGQQSVRRLAWIPWGLVGTRLGLGPILVLLCWTNATWVWAVSIVVLAFVTDVYDGVLARRWGVVTDQLRRSDSAADVAFYICVILGFAIAHPQVISNNGLPIAGLVATEALCQTINFLRFRLHTATHTYLCKIWSVFLCLTSIVIFSNHDAQLTLDITLVLGYLAYADVLLIICLLPNPAVDVPSSFHAWKQRSLLVANSCP